MTTTKFTPGLGGPKYYSEGGEVKSNIDQDVIDELIAMLEDHIAGSMKKPEEIEVDAEGPEGDTAAPGVAHEQSETPSEEDDEDMKKLMEMYSRG